MLQNAPAIVAAIHSNEGIGVSKNYDYKEHIGTCDTTKLNVAKCCRLLESITVQC